MDKIKGEKMTLVSIEKELAEELIDLKLQRIVEYINEILITWNYRSAEKFIKDARDGKLPESEDDAITLTNLLDNRDKLMQLKCSWS